MEGKMKNNKLSQLKQQITAEVSISGKLDEKDVDWKMVRESAKRIRAEDLEYEDIKRQKLTHSLKH